MRIGSSIAGFVLKSAGSLAFMSLCVLISCGDPDRIDSRKKNQNTIEWHVFIDIK
jgi:hypothetical protein